MKARRRARAIALQVLYELDFSLKNYQAVLQRHLDETKPLAACASFAQHLLSGVWKHRAEIDNQLARFAPEWPLDQIAAIDRNILRLAVFELKFDPQTPPKVAINEAVELAKLYGSESSPRFINGVLGHLLAEVDPSLETPIRTHDGSGKT